MLLAPVFLGWRMIVTGCSVRHCIRARWDRATNEEEMIDDASMALRVRKGL